MKKPAKSKNNIRLRRSDKCIKVYVMDPEFSSIEAAAGKAGISMSAWLRMIALKEAKKK